MSERVLDWTGVTVEWAQNPLASKVTADAAAVARMKASILRDLDLMGELSDDRAQRVLDYCVSALTSIHCGNCVCVACSCLKCEAEHHLGISTIAGVSSSARHHIEQAFQDTTSSVDAVRWLKTSEIKANWEGFEIHVPKWKAQRMEAAAWLEKYASEHDL